MILPGAIAEIIEPPARSAQRGDGHVELSLVRGYTALTRCSATSPLKILCPRQNERSTWLYASSFGGGLLAGDRLSLTVDANPGTTTFVSTQSTTRVYRSPTGIAATQEALVRLDEDATLIWLPDPVCCFADAVYEQRQRFVLAENASLICLDWFTSGRRARGERWAFSRFSSRTDAIIEGRHVVADALTLDRRHGPIASPARMGRFNCMATLLLIGPKVQQTADAWLAEVSTTPLPRRGELLISASPLRGGGVIVRILGLGVEPVARAIHERLSIVPEVLGEDPLARKW